MFVFCSSFLSKTYCGYSLEVGASNEYPQHMFSLRKRKTKLWVENVLSRVIAYTDIIPIDTLIS